jgi:hypothetical protein
VILAARGDAIKTLSGLGGPVEKERNIMKYVAFAFVGLFWLILSVPDANAVVCAAGVYRAGCVGVHGRAVVRRPVARRGVVVHRR